MIKIIATASIVLSGALFGRILCRTEKDTLDKAEELYDLIYHIKEEIKNKSAPLDRIFSDFMSRKGSDFMKEKFKHTHGSYGEKFLLLCTEICSERTKNELKDFALTLGKLDKESQEASLNKAHSVMEKELEAMREGAASKNRLYKALSLLVSCIIAVLLY